jgi:hypothetical protein
MNRREAVQRLSLLVGGVLSPPVIAGVMGQVLNTGESVKTTAGQEALIAEVADVIIPTTDTPGAKAAGAEKFIVRVMRDCYVKEDQDKFYAGLAKLDADSKTRFGKDFISLSPADKIEMVKQTMSTDKAFFLRMKELTTVGYFTSEIGATQALEYLPIPGRFDGSAPYKPGQKAWAI